MKFLKLLLLFILFAALGFGGLMFWKAKKSRSMEPKLGVINSQLQSCGPKPNCVSSFADVTSQFYIAPIESNVIDVMWDNLNQLLPQMGFEIVEGNDTYLHARAVTPMMKFVDDMEFLLKADEKMIYMRSASRVGYSDMGANRKRLESIRSALSK